MRTIRWEVEGNLRECKTTDDVTAVEIANAIAALWSGDGIKVQIWSGATMIREIVS